MQISESCLHMIHYCIIALMCTMGAYLHAFSFAKSVAFCLREILACPNQWLKISVFKAGQIPGSLWGNSGIRPMQLYFHNERLVLGHNQTKSTPTRMLRWIILSLARMVIYPHEKIFVGPKVSGVRALVFNSRKLELVSYIYIFLR